MMKRKEMTINKGKNNQDKGASRGMGKGKGKAGEM
jgi:hypothetical protein